MFVRYQPFKALYLSLELVFTLFVRIPVWTLLSIPRSWRPRRSWPISRVILVRLVKILMELPHRFAQHYLVKTIAIDVPIRTGPIITTPSHLAIAPGPGVNGVWVEAVPQLVTSPLSEWANTAKVAAVKIPGYWIHKAGSNLSVGDTPMPGEKVIYSMHGGSYAYQSAHPSNLIASISRGILEHTESIQRVFSIEYRLSGAAPFPAALLDALAGYHYLVNDVGFSPSAIIFEGDSAGANLALALARYLVERRDDTSVNLPAPPGALLLLSPWADLSHSHDMDPTTDSSSRFVNSDYTDIRPSSRSVEHRVATFLGPLGPSAAETNRYISPASKNVVVPGMDKTTDTLFKDFPRTFIVVGGAETLYDQIKTLISRMSSDLGVGDGVKDGEGKVSYYEAPDAIHDYLVFTWHELERSQTLKAIGTWVDAYKP
ncbi:hypothetical protein EYR40_002810 [Pleurotus pulmonarius]|nr:hypothetical protein EYR40_002810 [Pleurotus pulmonarius]